MKAAERRLEGVDACLERSHRATVLERALSSRVFCFILGFLTCGFVCGYLAGLRVWPFHQ